MSGNLSKTVSSGQRDCSAPIIRPMNEKKCSFRVGDAVIYKPTNRARGNLLMTGFSELVPGNTYKVVRIAQGA